MSVTTRRLVRVIAAILMFGAGLLWFFDFAYADWLRFDSPTVPDAATGQVVYEKALKGIFYITEKQHFWANTMLPPIWLLGALGFVLHRLTRERDADSERLQILPEEYSGKFVTALGYGWVGAMALLFFAGDYVMALIFTGRLVVPPVLH